LEEIPSDFFREEFREWEFSITEVTIIGTSLQDFCRVTQGGKKGPY
jgi:hypothetical protein